MTPNKKTINEVIRSLPDWKKRYVRIINYYVIEERNDLIVKGKSKLEIKKELSTRWVSYFRDLVLAKHKKEFDKKHPGLKLERIGVDISHISLLIPIFLTPFIGPIWGTLMLGALILGVTVDTVKSRLRKKKMEEILYQDIDGEI